MLYLPAYSPFLNPIKSGFSKWKNFVNRNRSGCGLELLEAIKNRFFNDYSRKLQWILAKYAKVFKKSIGLRNE